MGCCQHEALLGEPGKLVPPTAFTKIYKDECVLCFHQATAPEGLYVCASCFSGGCQEHARLHFDKTGHPLAIHLHKKAVPEKPEEESPSKVCRVEVKPPVDPVYSYDQCGHCFVCEQSIETLLCEPLKMIAEKIAASDSARKKADAQVWREQTTPCEHTLGLGQEPPMSPSTSKTCQECALGSNLWLCLTCGYVGCGRRQFDGSGGNGHAAGHNVQTGHPVSVKLGTITPEGEADVYCYGCDEMREDPALHAHLGLFGINLEAAERTEKSMAELQLEQNQRFDFSMATVDGAQMQAAEGPGCLGLVNLGNSCYMSSVVQVLACIPAFKQAYGNGAHSDHCVKDAPICFPCQLGKLQRAILNGANGNAVAPWMFKAVASSGHPDFSGTQQQDAAEYLSHLLRLLERNEPASVALKAFQHRLRQDLACHSCLKFRHRSLEGEQFPLDLAPSVLAAEDPLDPSISLDDCLSLAFKPIQVDMRCDSCPAQHLIKTVRLTMLPEILALPLSRFITENWVPRKLDLAVKIPFSLDLGPFLDTSEPAGETEPERCTVSEAALNQIMEMGFPKAKAIQALLKTGNNGPEAAMEWLFQHLEGEEAPEYTQVESVSSNEPSAVLELPQDSIEALIGAGYSEAHARAALVESGLDVNAAFEYLLTHPEMSVAPSASRNLTFLLPRTTATAATTKTAHEGSTQYDMVAFIAHKGPSMHCGHYVAYFRQPSEGISGHRWVLANDERLAVLPDEAAVQEAASKAYIYFYQRRGSE